jgi:tetratricopeptide (TPR) repeat protein
LTVFRFLVASAFEGISPHIIFSPFIQYMGSRFLLLFTVSLALVSLGTNAQVHFVSNKQLVSKAAETETLESPVIKAETQAIYILPLFGERPKTLTQQAADAVFLKSCDLSFGNRDEACKFFCERGWEYLAEGELDTAMYRFNLASLLQSGCSDVFWGMGVISFQRQKYTEATRLLHKGLDTDPNNAALMADLGTIYIHLHKENRNPNDILQAVMLLNKSISLDAKNPTAYLRLSLAEFQQENYDKAWEYVHLCRQLDETALDTSYIQELLVLKPDPQHIFK